MMLGKEPWRPSSNSDLACALMRAGFLQIFRFFSSHGKHVIYVSDVKEQSSWLCLELGCCCCCCFSLSVVSDSLRPHRLKPGGLLCPWDSPGKNTGVCCYFLLQRIFPTQGTNPILLQCRQTLYHLSHHGSREYEISSVQFSHSVVTNSLPPHGLQHVKLPYLSPTPRVHSNSCPLSQ